MTFNTYSERAGEFAIYPGKSGEIYEDLYYPCLGLAGEVGELIEPVKKWYRRGCKGDLDLDYLVLESGDILWYLNEFNRRLGVSLGDVARRNLEKLSERRSRDKVTG